MGELKLSDEQWLKLYRKGLSDYQIAKILGVSRESIRYRRKRLGLKANFLPKQKRFEVLKDKFVELWNNGYTYREIRKRLGVSYLTIKKWRKRLNLPGRRGQRLAKYVFYLYKVCRKDFDEIARELKISERKVRELVGFWLMELCRQDESCPYKPLLPEVNV